MPRIRCASTLCETLSQTFLVGMLCDGPRRSKVCSFRSALRAAPSSRCPPPPSPWLPELFCVHRSVFRVLTSLSFLCLTLGGVHAQAIHSFAFSQCICRLRPAHSHLHAKAALHLPPDGVVPLLKLHRPLLLVLLHWSPTSWGSFLKEASVGTAPMVPVTCLYQ